MATSNNFLQSGGSVSAPTDTFNHIANYMKKASERYGSNSYEGDPRLHYGTLQDSWCKPMQEIREDTPFTVVVEPGEVISSIMVYPFDQNFDDKDLEAFERISMRVSPIFEGLLLENAKLLVQGLNDRVRGKDYIDTDGICLRVEGFVSVWGYEIGSIFISDLAVCIVLRREKFQQSNASQSSPSVYESCVSHLTSSTCVEETRNTLGCSFESTFEPIDFFERHPKSQGSGLQINCIRGNLLEQIKVSKVSQPGSAVGSAGSDYDAAGINPPTEIVVDFSLQSPTQTADEEMESNQAKALVDGGQKYSGAGMIDNIERTDVITSVVKGARAHYIKGSEFRFGFSEARCVGGPPKTTIPPTFTLPSRIPRLKRLSTVDGSHWSGGSVLKNQKSSPAPTSIPAPSPGRAMQESRRASNQIKPKYHIPKVSSFKKPKKVSKGGATPIYPATAKNDTHNQSITLSRKSRKEGSSINKFSLTGTKEGVRRVAIRKTVSQVGKRCVPMKPAISHMHGEYEDKKRLRTDKEGLVQRTAEEQQVL